MTRKRTTWGEGREASAPPATPGYGTEDQDHPAHQADPAYEAYKKGDPSAWAEDVHPGPYPNSAPPSTPGYGTADQDHPAKKASEDVNLRKLVEKKASQCFQVAQAMLGKKATPQAVEDQALDLMDVPDSQLAATMSRLGGGFLSMDEYDEYDEYDDDMGMPMEDILGMGDMEDELPPLGCGDMMAHRALDEIKADAAKLQAEFKASGSKEAGEHRNAAEIKADYDKLQEEFKAAKAANQNAPKGPTLAPTPATEEQERAEGKATESGEKSAFEEMFDSYDPDGTGFVTEADWKGERALFAALDTDKDGILARHEVIAALEGMEKVAKGKIPPEFPPEFLENIKKKKDEAKDKDDGDDKEAKKAKKSDDDEDDEDDGDEMEAKKAKKSDDDEEVEEDDGDEMEAKKAKKASGQKPQRRKAASGAKRLGTQTRVASRASEVDELSKMWKTDPDVSGSF